MASAVPSLVGNDTDSTLNGYFHSELESIDTGGICMLKAGYPGRSTMESVNDIMKEACLKRLEDEAELYRGFHLHHYGMGVGDPFFRESLAKFLTKVYGYEVRRESLMATNGASPTLLLLCSMFFQAADCVFTEDPSYPIGLGILTQDARLKLINVPLDADGISTIELEAALQKHYPAKGFTPSDDKPFWSMLYLIPTFHNPTGCCLSEDRCKTVVRLARKYHLLVVCDDVYTVLQWELDDTTAREPVKVLKYYDQESDADYYGNVVSNGSFSKFLAPGLRLGWLDAPLVVLRRLVGSSTFSSGGDLNHFLSAVMGKALQMGLVEPHVADVCAKYKENLLAIHAVFEKRLKGIVSYTLPKGGFFLWVQLPDSVNCERLLELCMSKYKVSFASGTSFTTTPGRFQNFIRLCFSLADMDELVQGAEEISSAILELHDPEKV